MGISVCALYGRLTGRGLLTACEADVLGALAMLASYLSAMGRTVPHFIDWTIQHRENPNRLLAWHCGNAPSCLANNPAKTAVRSRKDMTGRLPIARRDPDSGLAQFQIKPGRVTFCRLAEYDNEWKMLITTGEIIPSDETLAGTWAWVQVKDHARLYRTLVEEGFVHHASMIHGDQAQVLVLACKFLGHPPCRRGVEGDFSLQRTRECESIPLKDRVAVGGSHSGCRRRFAMRRKVLRGGDAPRMLGAGRLRIGRRRWRQTDKHHVLLFPRRQDVGTGIARRDDDERLHEGEPVRQVHRGMPQ